ncbi:penicillin-insensitive murein endopeptidase [Nannocystaceae bacterium ST9]
MRRLFSTSFAALLTVLPLAFAHAGDPEPSLADAPMQASAEPAAVEPEPSVAPVEEAGVFGEVEGDPSEAPPKPKKKRSKSASKPKPSRNDEACDFRSPLHWHVVESGEHLGLIAGRYGVLSKDLLALNPDVAAHPDLIRVGQKLAVCPEIAPHEIDEREHVVAAGETFNGIAHANGLSPAELLEQQDGKLGDPSLLRVGQRLRIVTVGDVLPGFEPEPAMPGRLSSGRKLPESEVYEIKRPHNAWGTKRTIKLISQAVERYQRKTKGGPKLRIGDISREQGGKLDGHRSHQEGNDVDVGLVLRGKAASRMHFSGANADNLDVERTWLLIESFLETGEVRFIFLDYAVQKQVYEWAKDHGVAESKLDEYFQYPRGSGRNHGIIRHWRGHKNHIHVRFRD